MKTRTRVIGIAGVIAVTVLAGLALAAGGGRFGHDPVQFEKFITWKVSDTLDQIKATPEQRTKILAIKDQLVAEGKAMHESHRATHDQVVAQWNADSVDRDQLKKLADQRLEEFRATAYKAIDAFAQVHDTLTPAQRQQVLSEFKSMHHPE